MPMTPDAKRALSATIRKLRARLLEDLQAVTATAPRDEAARKKRARLDAWTTEQQRADSTRKDEDFRRDVEKQTASTLVNRLVLLRLMEAASMRSPAVLTGGWDSRGYKDFRQLAPALVRDDETEGYSFLLKLVFDDLARDLPGLYGTMGLGDLIPIPAAALRFAIDSLNAPELDSCWTDDMTLGWVYQYWNDPEREALDAKLNAGGKVDRHEIASKTQMFTERYMVDWLLQNSLGPLWLAMCKKHQWTPECQGVLTALEERRTAWRKQRDTGEVSLTDLMPLHNDLERHWAYYVPQPIPDDAIAKAPESLRALKLLDPAVGSGHFLVVALELLFALYQEEARHRGVVGNAEWTDRSIVEHILSHNLHGIDLDPRAAQIAAAALWLKSQQLAPGAHPTRLNLVASNLKLAALRDDDPALVDLRRAIEQETGIPAKLTDTLIHALRGADHLGSLLKIDAAVEKAIETHEQATRARLAPVQQTLFGAKPAQQAEIAFDADKARRSLVELLEEFLGLHTAGDDLGLRLRGEQLAAGVRFVRMIHPGTYDLVVANPPYQGTSKMVDGKYVEKNYELGKADLFAAFLLRGMDLVREGGVSAMLTMRNWMFIKQYSGLRQSLLEAHDLRALGDFAVGAFDEVPNDVLSVVVSVFHRTSQRPECSVGHQPTPPDDVSYDRQRTSRKRAATLCQVGRLEFDPAALKIIPEWPLVYWWGENEIGVYRKHPLIGAVSPAREGITTADNGRFRRWVWEIGACPRYRDTWYPFVGGASGLRWMAPILEYLAWDKGGLALKTKAGASMRNERFQGRSGVAFTTIGSVFGGRTYRCPSYFEAKGRSIFHESNALVLCLLNSTRGRRMVESLNPGVDFTVGDVNRLPLLCVPESDAIFAQIESAFTLHESHREPSVEFKRPGPSPWRHAQDWAQLAVDRAEGSPLPSYVEELDPEPPSDHLSFALGVALGRFGGNGEGILDPIKSDLSRALPAGILFLDGTLDETDLRDGLGHPAAAPLLAAWKAHGPALSTQRSLRDWLAQDFFKLHKGMYENRPIHWPLSSSKKTFVAWVNIHRMNEQTLRVLLADHLMPTLARIEGEINDLRAARDGTDKKAAKNAEKRYDQVAKARDELQEFIANVEQCADRGAPLADPKSERREQDGRYVPELDDGVMVNSAGLWPLLEPQWKEPKKWWKELSEAKGKKDYDWSHLAMRYWPKRVDGKCQKDPSLGVAHGCFWRYHPERAWAWELRLQDEIGPSFRIEERDAEACRKGWLDEHPTEALAAVEKEATRRMGRSKARKVVDRFVLLEAGLWTNCADELWAMELRLSQKQGAELCITAPDEGAARAGYVKAHPRAQKEREMFMKALVPPAEMFEEDEEEETVADEEEEA